MSASTPSAETAADSRPTIVLTLPSGWGRAVAAGLLAAFLGWAIPVAVAMGSFWAVADSPWLRQATWQDAATAGSSFWALSLGSPAVLGGISLWAIPGLWSLVQMVALRLFLGRMRRFTPASVWAAAPSFTGLAMVLVLPLADGVIWWQALLGALAISGCASLWAYARAARFSPKLTARLKPFVSGTLLGLAYLLVVNLVAFVALMVRLAKELDRVNAATEALQGPGGGALILWILQLSFLPLGAAWAAAWMVGSGFEGVGGELVTPALPPTQDLPLPMWELIPTDASASLGWIFLLSGFALGALWWFLLRKRSFLVTVIVLTVAAVVAILLMAAWMALSGASLGRGALSHLGPETWAATWRLAIPFLIPASAVPLVFHTKTVSAVREATVKLRSGHGTGDDPQPHAPQFSDRPFSDSDSLEMRDVVDLPLDPDVDTAPQAETDPIEESSLEVPPDPDILEDMPHEEEKRDV